MREHYCNGYCGKILTADQCYLNGKGYPSWTCKPCVRIQSRWRYRKRYKYNPHSARNKRLKRERYANSPEFRARKCEAERVRLMDPAKRAAKNAAERAKRVNPAA